MQLSTTDLAVLRLYQEPHRHYHSVFHVLEMLELHETGKTRGIEIPRYVQPRWSSLRDQDFISAVVAHDCVYNIGDVKGFNERSSLAAWKRLGGDDYSGVVSAMILATIEHVPPADLPETTREMVGHIIDLDMSVLGATREEFDRNSDNIREEFLEGGVEPDLYAAGRRAFFERTLAQPRIFFTRQFHNALEARARQNMLEDLAA